MRRPRRYRRSRQLVCHWTDEGFSIANYATGLQTVGSPLTAEVLDFFGDWRTLDELGAHLPQFSRPALAAAIRILQKCTLLERSDAPRAGRAGARTVGVLGPGRGLLPLLDEGRAVRA